MGSSNVPTPTKILVVEDNLVNQKLLVRLLERLGYRTDIANNGCEVLEVLSRESYAVILMDCQVPEMDGFEATEHKGSASNFAAAPTCAAATALEKMAREGNLSNAAPLVHELDTALPRLTSALAQLRQDIAA